MFEIRDTPNKGKGLFALQDIKKGELIGEYTGELIDKTEMDRRESEHDIVWIFTVDENLFIDAEYADCPVKYVNHSCEPNCEVEIKDKKVFYYAIEDIKKGDELTLDYSLDVASDDTDPYTCLCGAPTCRGTMKDIEA